MACKHLSQVHIWINHHYFKSKITRVSIAEPARLIHQVAFGNPWSCSWLNHKWLTEVDDCSYPCDEHLTIRKTVQVRWRVLESLVMIKWRELNCDWKKTFYFHLGSYRLLLLSSTCWQWPSKGESPQKASWSSRPYLLSLSTYNGSRLSPSYQCLLMFFWIYFPFLCGLLFNNWQVY